MSYYNDNAQDFFNGTISVDMSPLYREFLPLLPEKSRILDVGCGSGRDSKAFKDTGYDVYAIEPSSNLAQLAERVIGDTVEVTTIQKFHPGFNFDAIWACASLLHIPMAELRGTFCHLSEILKKRGIIYCSFKYGDKETLRGKRKFTDLNEALLVEILPPPLSIYKTWVTFDIRPDRKEQWLNALLIKD
ncbi:SAM-dependent methyltransferase [Idiomarina sp. X4]|uniref:class I SAM-dependent methyltransferase n=1 Tax=Idiomarina sp. X4 TaxID=2055892 RepID=UPI000C292A19|nr:class I SAM-dependent methyltransferase [Idiomarina sp. X4]ATZ73282.1 SAM-dependent methyltransferase [Idiomarina sp. X4]